MEGVLGIVLAARKSTAHTHTGIDLEFAGAIGVQGIGRVDPF